jgi:hypothetical protein
MPLRTTSLLLGGHWINYSTVWPLRLPPPDSTLRAGGARPRAHAERLRAPATRKDRLPVAAGTGGPVARTACVSCKLVHASEMAVSGPLASTSRDGD